MENENKFVVHHSFQLGEFYVRHKSSGKTYAVVYFVIDKVHRFEILKIRWIENELTLSFLQQITDCIECFDFKGEMLNILNSYQ